MIATITYWSVSIIALATGVLIVTGLWVGKVPETLAIVLLVVWAVGLLWWAWWAPRQDHPHQARTGQSRGQSDDVPDTVRGTDEHRR